MSSRIACEAFVCAEAMKAGPFEADGFNRALATFRAAIANDSTEALLLRVHDDARRRRFKTARWKARDVDLSACSVCPLMGGRRWATGPADRVAELAITNELETSRLWTMAELAGIIVPALPIIVIRRHGNPNQLRIDDGSHRAVAAAIAGLKTVPAIVGTINPKFNLNWKWEGQKWPPIWGLAGGLGGGEIEA